MGGLSEFVVYLFIVHEVVPTSHMQLDDWCWSRRYSFILFLANYVGKTHGTNEQSGSPLETSDRSNLEALNRHLTPGGSILWIMRK